VAGFIGSPAMNFINGRLEGAERPTLVTASGFKIPLSSAPRLAAGSEIVMGVRPEHAQVIARIAGQDIVCVFRERLNGRPEDSIGLTLEGPLHFFDAKTGQALAGD
jgi:multiple sugar transport system ATP-binding protein